MIDPYEILGVTPDSTVDEIRDAYRKLAQQWHPDKHPKDVGTATRKFQELAEAYTILSDATKRARYDDLGEAEETKENELTGAAIQMLTQSAMQILDHVGDHLAQLKALCEAVVMRRAAAIQEAALAIRRREQLAKKWKTKRRGRNIFANALRRDVARLKESIKSSEKTIEVAKECLRILGDYEFQWQDETVAERERRLAGPVFRLSLNDLLGSGPGDE